MRDLAKSFEEQQAFILQTTVSDSPPIVLETIDSRVRSKIYDDKRQCWLVVFWVERRLVVVVVVVVVKSHA